MSSPLNVLFVPGVPTEPDDLTSLFDALPSGAIGHIVRPPGYGAPADGPGDFDARAAALRDALDQLPYDGRWIVGYSAGGYDALRALDEGAHVDGIVLLNAAVGPADDEERAQFLAVADIVQAGGISNEMLAAGMLTPEGLRNRDVVERTGRWMQSASADHVASELRSYARQPSLEHVVAAHARRIVFVHAEHDQSVPFERARALAERTGAAFVAIPGLGHAACMENASATCSALRQAWACL